MPPKRKIKISSRSVNSNIIHQETSDEEDTSPRKSNTVRLGDKLSKAYKKYHTTSGRRKVKSQFNKIKKDCLDAVSRGQPSKKYYQPIPPNVVDMLKDEGVRYIERVGASGEKVYELRWSD